MRKVRVYSRPQFCKLTPDKDVCVISIWTPEVDAIEYDKFPITNYDGWKDALKITFNDVTYQGLPHWKLFNHDLAKQIVAFVYKYPSSDFVIHCDAGMSRSVAVGCYLRDMIGYELELNSWPTDEMRNSLVYGTLMSYR